MNAVFKQLTLGAALLIAIGFGSSRAARSEEAGSGHYLPGATSSFIDLMPDRETPSFAYLTWIFRVLSRGSTHHLHSHQSSDQDRQIKLTGDTFGDCRVAGLKSQRSYVTKSDGG
jgi:hypothetical protein